MRAYKSRLSAFDDSIEIAEALGVTARIISDHDIAGESIYWIKEAEVHIEGLWWEAKRMERKIKQLEKKANNHEA
jgi:hypothetical protein